MNGSDFVVLPGSKAGLSVKLKAKSVRELQVEKVQLERENKEMEKKLKQLQSNMSREKRERERANGYHWKSGQFGLGTQTQLLSHNKENVGKVSSGKVRLKVLKEPIQAPEPGKQLLAHKAGNAAAPEKPKVKGKTCGQCETKAALLVCLECGEDYCPGCFAKLHQKGALKLHRTIPLQAKAQFPIGKLEAAQQFLKKVNPGESNCEINDKQKKEIKNQLDLSSPLHQVVRNSIEEASTIPTWTEYEEQNGGSLLHGTFDEEASSRFFQEALIQWRSGIPAKKPKEERSCQVESVTENIDTSEVQTSPPFVKKPFEIVFKEDGLKYIEKLWLMKHRRMPVDKWLDATADELNTAESLINEGHDALVGQEDEEEEDVPDTCSAVEELKTYWANLFRKEDPKAVPVNMEPSLKIEILADDCKEDLGESATFVVIDTGSDELTCNYSGTMPENRKTEPDIFLAQSVDIAPRSPLSSAINKENCSIFICHKHDEAPRANACSSQTEMTDACGHTSTEEIVSNALYESAVRQGKRVQSKNSSLFSSEQTSDLAPGGPATELLTDPEMFLELEEALPETTKSSLLLQGVALREKPVCVPYCGLEKFFTIGTSTRQVAAALFPRPPSGGQSPRNKTSFSGSGDWMSHFSLRECADESIVQDVLKGELRRSSRKLGSPGPRTRSSLLMSPIDCASPRPRSANLPRCRTFEHVRRPSSVLQTRPGSSTICSLSRAASEISEIEGIDATEHDDPFLELHTDQQALEDLENELQSNTAPQEKLHGLASEDLSAFSRPSQMTSQNLTEFHKNYEIKDYSKGDTIRVYDESQTDDEDDLWREKQQVIELR